MDIRNNTLDHESKENEDYPEDLICPICLDLYWDPVELIPCKHIFCDTCITRLNHSRISNCPICRGKIEDTMPIDNTIRETYPNHIQEREDREQNSNAGYNMDQLALPLPDDTDFELFFEETDSENDLETVDDDSDDSDYEPTASEDDSN